MVEAMLNPFATQAHTFVTGLITSVAANATCDGLRYTSGQLANRLTNSPVEQLPENNELERAAYRAYLRTCQMLLGLESYVHPIQRAANPHSKGQIHVLAALEIALKQINGDDWRAHLPNKQQFANAQQLVANALSRHEAVQEAGIAEAREPTPDASGFSELEQWIITYAIKDLNNRALDVGQTLPTESLLKRFNNPNKGFLPVYKHFIGKEIIQGDEAFFRIFIATELANASAGVANTAHTINTLRDAVVAEISEVTTLVKAEFQALSQQMSEQSGKLAAPNLQPQLKIPPTQDSITHFTQRAFKVIGREKEQKTLREFLHAPADVNNNASSNLKWIQIAGQGGQGKSRLALELVMEALEIETSDSQHSNHKRSTDKQRGKWKAGMLERSALTEFLTFADTWQPDCPHLMVFDYLVGNEAPIAALFKTLTERRQQFRYPVRVVLVERQAWNKGGFTRKASASHLSTTPGSKTTNRSLTNSDSFTSNTLDDSLSNQDLALHISPRQGNAEWYDKLAAEGFTYLSETRFGSGVVELGRLPQAQLALLCQQVAMKQNPAATLSSAQIEQQLAKIDTSGRPLYAYFLGQALAQNPDSRYNTKEQLLYEILQHDYRRRWLPTAERLKANQSLPPSIELSGQALSFTEESYCLRLAIIACIVRVIDIKQVAQQANWPKPHPDEIYLAQVINDNPVNAANIQSPRYIAGLQPDLLGEYFVLLQLDDMRDPEPIWQLCWKISPTETAAFLLRTTQDFPTHEITQRLLNIAPPNREGETALEGVAADITLALHAVELNFPKSIIQALQRAADNSDSKHALKAMMTLAWLYQFGNEVVQDLPKANQLWQKAAKLSNADAMVILGINYQNGNGVEQDLPKANQLYQQAVELGNTDAMTYLGNNYSNGKGVEQDLSKANQLYQLAAKLGNAIALNNLALNYGSGNGVEQDIQKANQLWQQAAELGDANAMFNLGINYHNNYGVVQDLKKANQFFQQAAELGHPSAMVNLAINYEIGKGVEQDIQKANELYQKAANLGNAEAMFNLGTNYESGNGVVQDLEKANQLYQQAAELDHSNAMVNLAINYENGKGVEQDLQKAIQLYQQAIDLDNTQAMVNLAINYGNGNGVEQDLQKASQLYQQAVELGNAQAMINLGYNYENGKGVEQDIQKANQFYQQAAELGDTKAMFKLGNNYENGNGVEQDLPKANQLYQQAAEQGNAKAMVLLGANYLSGNGIEQDLPKAIHLWQQAAKLGNADAMILLGFIYQEGTGVEQDQQKAFKLWQQAADLGHDDAKQILRHFMQEAEKSNET